MSGEIAFVSISIVYVKIQRDIQNPAVLIIRPKILQMLNLLLLSVVGFSDFCEIMKYIIHYKNKETKSFT